MSKPGEHKTVQARILAYAEAIGWTIVSREEAERRRGFDAPSPKNYGGTSPEVPPADRARNRSLFFDDLLDGKVREFNSRYAEAGGALLGRFRYLHTDIYGNREFVEQLRNRGIIVTMIHKFRDMPADLNTRANIFVLIDEAHRTTGGDLGNFLMAGLPNATFIGFTGTPVDKTVYGKGTFKTFGCEDDQGYLHKYSIVDSIEDGTTLPLHYQLAPNEMLVPHETLDKEFLSLAEAEGVADIEELNKILERAVNLKNFLKGKERIQKVAQFVAGHYRENVEPLGYKAYTKTVMVDRAFQKKTNELVQKHIGSSMEEPSGPYLVIDHSTIETIQNKDEGNATKVINLIKSIEKLAEEGSDDPYLIAMAERAQVVQESFEQRQISTTDALEALLREVEKNEVRKKEQAEKSFDGLTYFVYRSLLDAKIANAEAVSRKIRQAFADHPNWKRSENALRELRKKVTFAIFAEMDDLDRVTGLVDQLFTLLEKADRI